MTIITATDENNAIGGDNQLLWHLSDDLKRFKNLTQNHVVIMGRKTFESLAGPLPKRVNIVVSGNSDYKVPENVILAHSLPEAIAIAKEKDANPFVIGGGIIYKQALDLADTIELTLVHTKVENADTYFPEIRFSDWEKVFEEFHPKDEKHLYDFTFLTYHRK
ncbi:MAG: dihydrofolate reductase [Flavobacteriaceae bacterium]|jgi:dihydrofolate reductase|nr:dihydrofolate reductase [Flavobacteriaceae bacterium]